MWGVPSSRWSAQSRMWIWGTVPPAGKGDVKQDRPADRIKGLLAVVVPAYDKAVEVVTDTVRQETHKEDIRLVEESKKWVLSPERKAPKKEREYAAARLDGVINKIKNVMQTALAKIQRTLMQPEVKQAGKEQVKKKAKESIMDMLAKAKINADRDNRERWEREGRIAPKKKHDMEL